MGSIWIEIRTYGDCCSRVNQLTTGCLGDAKVQGHTRQDRGDGWAVAKEVILMRLASLQMIDAERFEPQCQFKAADGVKLLRMHLDTKILFKSTREHRFSLSGAPRLLLNEDVHCLCKMAAGGFRNQFTPNLARGISPLASVAGWNVNQQRRDNPDRQTQMPGPGSPQASGVHPQR